MHKSINSAGYHRIELVAFQDLPMHMAFVRIVIGYHTPNDRVPDGITTTKVRYPRWLLSVVSSLADGSILPCISMFSDQLQGLSSGEH